MNEKKLNKKWMKLKLVILLCFMLVFLRFQKDIYANIITLEERGADFIENQVGYHLDDYQCDDKIYLFNEHNRMSAVYMKYDDSYVVYDILNDAYPVIEYAFNQKSSFIDETKRNLEQKGIKDVVYYYTSGMTYYVRDIKTNSIYNISDGEVIYESNKYFEDEIFICSSAYKGGNIYITNPDTYERGYYSKKVKNVSYFDITYNKASDFAEYQNHCAPIAATNFMRYWYNKNKTVYKGLKYKNSWNSTFKKLHKIFKTTDSNGTKLANVVSGFILYFDEMGANYKNVGMIKDVGFSAMQKEIDRGYPFYISVINHDKYKNHGMFAVGYVIYVHAGSKYTYSYYIRVADGNSSSKANRYINAQVGQSRVDMIYVHLQ